MSGKGHEDSDVAGLAQSSVVAVEALESADVRHWDSDVYFEMLDRHLADYPQRQVERPEKASDSAPKAKNEATD